MAYLARIERSGGDAIALPELLAGSIDDGFTGLEWSIIRLARIDALSTIRPPGLLRRFWNALVGRTNPELANERLEALRKIAVLGWHFGSTIPRDDVADFLAAGFTQSQFELLVTSITSVTAPQQRQSLEAFA